MRRISSFLLILALFRGSITTALAGEPGSEATQDGANDRGKFAQVYEASTVNEGGRSLALGAKQLALWQEDPTPAPAAKPGAAALPPPKPAMETRSPLRGDETPAGQAVPLPKASAEMRSPLRGNETPTEQAVPLPKPYVETRSPVRGDDIPVGQTVPLPTPSVEILSPLPGNNATSGQAVLPPKPTTEMRFAAERFVAQIPPASASPAPLVPDNPAPPPIAVPDQVPNSPPAKGEKLTPEKDAGPPQPFSLLGPERETVVTVTKGRSQLLRSKIEFTRTAVVDPGICDVLQYSPTEIGFIGKEVGTTEVTVWFRESDDPNIDTQPRSFLVHVEPEFPSGNEPHLRQLEAELAKLFPNSKVRLRTFGRRIIVLGQARDVAEAAEILNFVRGESIDTSGKWVSGPSQAEPNNLGTDNVLAGNSLARSNNPDRRSANTFNNRNETSDRVMNMLKVPGVHQIMLRVKIAELDRSAARNFGANFSSSIQFRNGTLLLQSLLNASNNNSIIGNFSNGQLTFGISYLEQHGVIRLLSEPTLMTMSGKPANMVAGGEFAVPTVVGVSGVSAVSTNFVAYGAIVSFTPYLLDKDLIRLNVSPEFSQIDNNTSVNGIPGLTTRAVTTTVELRAGQTLALAGLLSDSMTSNTQSDWPWIGKLIGPRNVARSETELIVLVTPELVQPMEPEEVPPVPGFDVTEPDNVQFFLRGDIEGAPTQDYRSTVWPILQHRYRAGGSPMISGPFGHSNAWTGEPSSGRN